MHHRTKKLVTLSLLIALNIIFTRIASIRIPFGGIEGVRMGVGPLPLLLSGIIFGPISGFVVGVLGDVIGHFLSPLGAYVPHFTFSAGLSGFIPGFIYYFCNPLSSNRLVSSKSKHPFPSFLIIFVSILVGQVVTSLVLTPYFLNTLFSIPYEAIIIPRIIVQAISIPIFSWTIWVLMNRTVIFD